MLAIYIQNDSTGTEKVGNYLVTVAINNENLWTGNVRGFQRRLGWYKLLKRVMKEAKNYDS